MLGGELVASGSDSCVFIPNLPCKIDDPVYNNRVSKIIYGEDREDEFKYEKKMNDKIKKIKGYSSWAIIFDKFCKPPPMELLIDYDKKGIHDCITKEAGIPNSQFYDSFDYFNDTSYMMNGIYGGITLDDYFYNQFKMFNYYSRPQRDRMFLKLMKMMEPLFLGVKKMNEKKIIHNDIKPNNIVVHNNVFKFIDFGLAGMQSDKKHFQQRSLDEFRSKRIYIYYPLDYLFFYSKGSLYNEINYFKERINFNVFYDLNQMFRKDTFDILMDTIETIQNAKLSELDMIKKIDVYSLGVIIPLLLLNIEKSKNILIKNIQESDVISSFFNLFEKMINPLSKDRMNAEDAYKEFKKLLRKFQKTPKKKKRTSTKKRKQRIITKKRRSNHRRRPIYNHLKLRYPERRNPHI